MGMEEELRAKAIASMSVSENHKNNPKTKAIDEDNKLKKGAESSSSPFQQGREEGELSSEDADAGPIEEQGEEAEQNQELPAQVASAASPIASGSNVVTAAPRDKHAQSSTIAGKCVPANSLVNHFDAQPLIAILRNHRKHLEMNPVPSRSSNHHKSGWYGPSEADSNLVIRFSDDDDSGSDSDEHKSVRTSDKRDVTLVENMDKRPVASSQIKARTLQRPPASQAEMMLKKVSMSRTFISTMARVHRPSARGRGASSAERESHIRRNASMHKSSTSQEPGGVQGVKSTDNELEILRREIALRESELMSQRKNVPQHKEKVSVSYGDCYGTRAETNASKIGRPAPVSTVGLAAGEHDKKRLKSNELSHVSLNSVDQRHVPVPAKQIRSEFKNKVLENLCTKDVSMITTHPTGNKRQREDHEQVPVSSENLLVGAKQGECSVSFVGAISATSPNVGAPPKQQNNSLFGGGISGSCSQSNKSSSLVDAFSMLNRSSGLVQMTSNADDDATVQPACSPEMPPKNSGSQRSKQAGTVEGFHLSSLLQSKETSQHNLVNSNEPNKVISGNRLLMPRNILNEHSHLDLENMLRTFDASVYNESMLNHLRQSNSEGRSGLDAQTLAKIEELQDKELEEAQELRRRCELEELSALKAYRSAQRALIDANERCSYLYQRRELFSSQVQAFIMKNSSSLWPSRWRRETGIDSLRNVSEPNVPLRLSCPMQAGRDVLDLEARESNMLHTGDAPLNTSYQQVNRHSIGSEPCSEPDASTSEQLNHKDISAVDGVFSPSNNPDVSADEDEGVESRLVRAEEVEKLEKREGVMNEEVGRKHYIESSHNSELVEASLRSELFARLGMRMPKNSDLIFDGEHNVETRAQNDVESRETHLTMGKLPALSDQQFVEEEQNEMADTEGTDRPGSKSCHNSFLNHGKSHCKKPGSDFGCHRNNLEESSSSLEESCRPNYESVFSLPSSVLKTVFRHTKVVLSDRCEGYHAKEENACRISDEDAIDASCHENQLVISRIDVKANDIRIGRIGKLESCTSCPVIHPLWPFCMFELRGKCNDDECSWQHARDYTQKNLKQHHDSFSSDGHVSPSSVLQERSDALELVHSLHHYIVPVPTYRIGSKLIKADKHLPRSVLARDLSQYWRRDFCTSFAVPFCMLRIAPPDVPSLQASDCFDEDYESRSRLSLYFQSQDGNTKKLTMEGLTASEQSLELALDLYNGAVNEQDGKKQALTVLSRSLEVDPSSVVLWIIYLHIYYAKEKAIGKDDMFFLAIQHNEGAYELWLMYINSRMHLGDRLGAYDTALSTLCRLAHAPNRESKYSSACVLDLFLQMVDFLRMTGDVEKAILRVCGLLPAVMDFNDSSATLMSDILSCLTISDKCILWICCVYLLIYEKLPEAVVQRFEFEQELLFQLEWPSIQLTSDKRNQAIELMKVALDTLTLSIDDDSHERETALRSVHSLAVNHIRCIAAIEGIDCAKDLLIKYVKQYPTCIELVLTLARCQRDNLVNEGFNGFEEAMCNWPKEVPGIQCIWNQYLEYAMENGSVSLVEKLMLRWFDSTREVTDAENGKVDCGKSGLHSLSDLSTSGNFVSGNRCNAKDELFGLLNLSFYRLFQNDQAEARRLLDKALKLAPAEDLKHFVGEHTLFLLSEGLDPDAAPPGIPSLLLSYLIDSRSFPVSEPLSRKFATSISKPRIRQLINTVLGPVSFDCSLMNSVLKELYGPSLLPENFGKLKDLVDFVEDLMEILPANYQLAMSACKFLAANIGGITSATAIFWASSLLVNSVFQASPAAPEQAWIQVADILGKLEMKSISERFHQQAVSVYPFSVKLWESYINLSKETGNVNAVLDAARERGI